MFTRLAISKYFFTQPYPKNASLATSASTFYVYFFGYRQIN